MDLAIAAAATDVGLTTKLASLLPILDAFNYRHRNQHSASHWWSAFRQFRHGARSLAADLHRHQALNQPHTDSSKKSTAAKAKAKRAQKQLLARLALFRNHTVPKAYICFSQLIADNQHAALGLLLFSALASVNSILDSISPPQQQSSGAQRPVADTSPSSTPSTSNQPRQGRDENTDRGVTISRDRIAGVAPKPSKRLSPAPNEDAAAKNRDSDTQSNKKRPVRSIEKADQVLEADQKQKKKKSKKKAKGDELSSLFGSL
ncbi:uncharacterized protein LMH87_008215 [Akanthomyces muscarius]|uniref:RNase MRP protein 1 RNA binding domain-containing protein n=1 Tax=Akanthomyces muscarius TaxID=2231603 RepID=A0A9W8QLP1_AKAMU|nr:uncharacterized protein LMH87_008215 [Akanthomyces muscarius]KAJ4159308.1 hypothetical protein LMH87_008215 [Akanthomyces muscarius]